MEQVAQYAPMVAQGVGTFLSAKGERDLGKVQRNVSEIEALQLERNAGQVQAAGQREAEDERRKTTLLLSRAQAVSAASGAGAVDPTVLKIIAGIAGEGELNAATTMYNYDEYARGQRNEAKTRRLTGVLAERAGKTRALTTALTGAASMASRWGGTWQQEKEKKALSASPGYDYGYSSQSTSEFYK